MADVAADDGGGAEAAAAADNAFGIPAHLIERAKAARARREAM